MASFAVLLGRILLSAIFILSGITKLMNWSTTAEMMRTHGLPAVDLLLPAAAAVELIGGVCLLLGLWGRWAALLLFLFLIPTTVTFHNFWAYQGAAQQTQMINFLKNIAIMGGMLAVAGLGVGAYSLDALWQRRTARTVVFEPRAHHIQHPAA